MKRSLCVLLLILGCGLAAALPAAAAGAYPPGKCSFLIGNAPGGGNDLLSRALIPGMSRTLGVEVLPENLVGANGGVAAVRTQQSKPDGHTLYMHSQSVVMMQYTGQPQVNVTKLAPVAQVAEDFGCFAVAAGSPYASLRDLIAAARANPGKIKVGTTSAGVWPINLALVEEKAGVKFHYVPYSSGGAPAGAAAAAGEVEVAMDSPIVYRSLVEGGKLKMLVTFGEKRSDIFPNVPTAKEQGVDVEFPVWRMVFTTAGTPEPILAELSAAVKAAMENDAFKTYMKTSGVPARFRDYKESAAMLARENVFYRDMLAKLGMKTSDPMK